MGNAHRPLNLMWVRLNRVNLVDLADNTDRYLLKKWAMPTDL
ncbi:hypothetical protein CKA32_006970 [Geitlerinema sp. FC II]|nr:hypothetical protein CKA32_006970 [Geitlerinema sp. FC II]